MEASTFKTKKTAHTWYVEQGGQLQYSQFASRISAQGRKVDRFDVSELLRKEQPGGSSEGLDRQKKQLEVEDLRAKVAKRELENRKEDARWIPKQDVTLQMAALMGLVHDTLRHHLHIESQKIALTSGIEAARIGELETAVEQLVLDQAFNEIAAQKLVDLNFE